MTMRTACRNRRCAEPLRAGDGNDPHVLRALGFCPSCRAAITLGFNVGGGLTIALGVLGALIGWWAK